MRIKHFLYCITLVIAGYYGNFLLTGCAQIGMPTGGLKDSLPPVLVSAQPNEKTVRFNGKTIVLTFDEYVEVTELQTNVQVSPLPKQIPAITSKLKTITIKLKDTLLANTTYAINFGNAIKDINENNPYKNYTYVFSTGDVIDSLQLSGKVILAESGKIDSTLSVLLYRDGPDSAVQTQKPDYLTRLNGSGRFTFTNLAPGTYKVYALKDGDGGKTYNSPIEQFAFSDAPIVLADTTPTITLYAYAAEKDTRPAGGTTLKNAPGVKPVADKKLKYTTPVMQSGQSLLTPLELSFTAPLKDWVKEKFLLTDTNYKQIPVQSIELDSTKKILRIAVAWVEELDYRLQIAKDAVTDTTGTQLVKADTIRFRTKSKGDYGSLLLRFTNYDSAKHPVLQLFKGDIMVKTAPITGTSWMDRLFEPGEYEIRILYDRNNNGKWDPGDFTTKLQPERVITTDKKITVKANWENEKDVAL